MWKKLLILSLCISVLFVFSALISPVNAGSKNVNWKVAGSIANYVGVVTSFSPFTITPHYLISVSAKGPPGNAEITLMGVGVPAGPDPACNEDEVRINILQNEMVARFSDLSLLFAIHAPDSYLCSTEEGTTTFNINMVVSGGTGRFEGATGNFTGTGFGYPLNPDPNTNGPLSAETAEIIGTIYLPN